MTGRNGVVSAIVPGVIAVIVFVILLAMTLSDHEEPPPIIEETPDEVIYPAVLAETEVAEVTPSADGAP